ncbi:uncharacterized protein LOC132943611 [Metopolophium dirhodum]|uniref:uncharacterized protein LOC132943611 n=1 Tax=Metopolophium dirhodum TaxID=44670 RepID=UPI0029905453|nr:uncharacterized protein LOC132943611 [Metopolophium dirhodum]
MVIPSASSSADGTTISARYYHQHKKTTLIAFFELCSHDNFAKTLFYHEVPSYYTWDNSRGWLKRRRGKDVPGWPGIKMDTAIGRIYTIHPNQIFCQPSEPQSLWEQFRNDFCEDILHTERTRLNDLHFTFSDEIFNRGLIEIEDKVVCLSEKYLTEFGMNSPVRNENASDPFEFSILRSYDNNRLQEFKASSGKVALAVASSGIAATLLSGGRTAHSTFKLPLNVLFDTEYVCPIRKNGPLGKILQETSFVEWDECTMSHRSHIEAIDRTLKDLRCNNKFMGGITFVFAGDFRQTLPVIPKGTRADVINACLKSSPIWNYVEKLYLRTNMRVYLCGGDDIFPAQLLKIGNGTLENENGYISVDHTIGRVVNNVEELISTVYPDIFNLSNKSYQWLCERAIISPRNVTAEEINDIILLKFDGHSRECLSIDTVTSTDDAIHYPQEFLNSLSPSGFPPHKLKLKIGAPITLLRNLQPPNLCNDTKLQIKSLRNNIIEAVILTGPAKGEIAFIPRIPMIPSDLPFSFKRLQFPVKVSFAITINKAQDQTFKVSIKISTGNTDPDPILPELCL